MRWLRTILRELFGLFVDDGRFAIAIIVWLVMAGLLLPRLGLAAGLEGLVLFAGLAGILFGSAFRKARALPLTRRAKHAGA